MAITPTACRRGSAADRGTCGATTSRGRAAARSLRIRTLGAFALPAVLLITGCGVTSGSTLPSPFSGSWTGTSLVFAADSGAALRLPNDLSVTVDRRGKLTGGWADSHGGGTVAGSVSPNGMLDVAFQNAQDAQDTLKAKGLTTLGPDGRWRGSLPVTVPAIAGLQIVWAVQPP